MLSATRPGEVMWQEADLLVGDRVDEGLEHVPQRSQDARCIKDQQLPQALGVVVRRQLQEGECEGRVQVRNSKSHEVVEPDPLLHTRGHAPYGHFKHLYHVVHGQVDSPLAHQCKGTVQDRSSLFVVSTQMHVVGGAVCCASRAVHLFRLSIRTPRGRFLQSFQGELVVTPSSFEEPFQCLVIINQAGFLISQLIPKVGLKLLNVVSTHVSKPAEYLEAEAGLTSFETLPHMNAVYNNFKKKHIQIKQTEYLS
mmetsp:Transcript_15117/g.32789  ORF Transcript_15117/g.32789 Transcript_15117/m.32789 type:complete len:253 (-) Transcript_15117:32-790(-)